MLKRIVRKKYSLDLGSNNTRLWGEDRGVVINEPTILALSSIDGSLVAIGEDAKAMIGKTPETLTSVYPVEAGAVADTKLSALYIRNILSRVSPKFQVFGPDIMVNTPSGSTQVERRAILDSVLNAGASHAYLVDTTLASSIGSGIPVSGASGHMIVNIGAQVTEAAVLSLGGVVLSETKRIGSGEIDIAIADYIKNKYSLVIGRPLSEELKIKLGAAISRPKNEKMEISGRDIVYGLPRLISISSQEITDCIQKALFEIIYPVTKVLENIPPELASDVIEKGIIMTGGGSLLYNFDKFLTEQTGIPSHVADDPELCAVRGCGVILQNLDLWKRSILTK